MAKSDKREVVHLACEVCKRRNYSTMKHRKTPKLELKKYCKWDKKHTMHKQTK